MKYQETHDIIIIMINQEKDIKLVFPLSSSNLFAYLTEIYSEKMIIGVRI